MSNAIFSISTDNYIKNAAVSLGSFSRNCTLPLDIFNLTIQEIYNEYQTDEIKKFLDKYGDKPDILRWCLKSVLLLYFLVEKKYDSVIYIDNDLYFVNNVDFLVEETSTGILLTKHNRPLYPSSNRYSNDQFLCNFTDGFFNAGFIGASHKGLDAIKWWISMNYWQCVKAKNYGLFDDQKYLDVMALEFNGCIKICNHPGCNLATWNSQTVHRSFENNKWIINGSYDPIFCHFSGIKNQPKSMDPMLHKFYSEYNNELNSL